MLVLLALAGRLLPTLGGYRLLRFLALAFTFSTPPPTTSRFLMVRPFVRGYNTQISGITFTASHNTTDTETLEQCEHTHTHTYTDSHGGRTLLVML